MHEYILTRLAEDEDSILCSDDNKRSFHIPKDRCRMVQQSYMWDRKLPDTIIIRIPEDVAKRFNLDCWEDTK